MIRLQNHTRHDKQRTTPTQVPLKRRRTGHYASWQFWCCISFVRKGRGLSKTRPLWGNRDDSRTGTPEGRSTQNELICEGLNSAGGRAGARTGARRLLGRSVGRSVGLVGQRPRGEGGESTGGRAGVRVQVPWGMAGAGGQAHARGRAPPMVMLAHAACVAHSRFMFWFVAVSAVAWVGMG